MFKEKIYFYIKNIYRFVNNKHFAMSVFLICLLLILYNYISFVTKNSINIPFWDQWGGVSDIIINKFDFLKTIPYQHNEHRIGVGLLIMKALANFSNWSQHIEIGFISILIIISSFIISYIRYNETKEVEILDIIIPLVMLNLFQAENITWGFQIAFVLPLVFLCIWLLALKITNVRIRYIILTVLSLLSSFSSFHGLILPSITIMLLLLDYFKYKLVSAKILIVTSLTNILIISSYFINYVNNFQTKISILPSIEMIKYFSVAISKGIFYPTDNLIIIDLTILLVLLSFFSFGVLKLIKDKNKKFELLIGIFLIIFSLIFVYIISIGRSSFGTEQALSSRYVTFTMLFPLGLFFIFSTFKYSQLLKSALLILILLNLVLFTNRSLVNPINIVEGKRKALDCYKTVEISNLDKCYKVFTLYHNEEALNQKIVEVLQYKNINEFKN